MPHIESLYITNTGKRGLFDVISLNETPSMTRVTADNTVPFSKLRLLALQDSSYIGKGESYSSILGALIRALRPRKARGMELETLIIKDGNGMNQGIADNLGQVVKNLCWNTERSTF